ncbi:MAG: PDZ domain-containing protein, partial [Chthoniobacterales bacterium]|nr:PDZ domain-containing protein [Chthoniobacterales bacterium]
MRTPKKFILTAALACLFWINLSFSFANRELGQIATAVARLLEQHHFTRRKLDAELSAQFFDNYLRILDPNRLYFFSEDVEEFRSKFGRSLHEYLQRGDVSPALEIFGSFRQRVENRVSKNLQLIEEPFDFTSNRTVEIDRKNSPWPANPQEADKLWRARIEGEMLQEHLAEARIDSPKTVLTRRYNQLLRSVQEQETNDIISTFLSALAQTYDPHSDYMSPHDMENFAISMRLSLVGVGAVLRSDEGYARVIEIVPGGPADKDGRLKVNDRIAAVAQGEGPFEDTVGMKLDKVVEKIRGPKGTKVRLLVIPAGATDSSQR